MAMINTVNEFLDDLRGGKMEEAPIVTVAEGRLQGRLANTPSGKAYYSFQGIPYAKPPLGSLRFKAPQPIEPWEGVRDATAEGNVSAQIDPIFTKQYTGDENCLFLNVYTPDIATTLPVMVYAHGGGFIYGSGNTDLYGPDYLVEKGVIIVTLNYRLGALGFLSLDTEEVPGNAGLRDIILALNWVKDNIHSFGGDASNLSVFGESAGGAMASLLTASPLSKHIVSKAILQSGTAMFNFAFQKSPVENAKALAQKLGFEGDNVKDILEFLNSTPAKDIVVAQQAFSSEINPNIFTMVVEKEFPGVESVISEPFIALLTSGRVARVPIMIGTTTLEFASEKILDEQYLIPQELNIPSDERKAIVDEIKKLYFKGEDIKLETNKLISDLFMNIDTHRYVQHLKHNTNTPIFYYKFDYVGDLNISNKTFINPSGLKFPMHLDDLGYLFKNDFQKDAVANDQDVKMRERMVRLWTNFAKTGNPTPDQSHYLPVTWQPVTKDTNYYLNLGTELALCTNKDEDKMAFWDELYSKHFKIWDQSRPEPTTATNNSVDTIVAEPKIIDIESVDAPKIVEEQIADAVSPTDSENQQEIVDVPVIDEKPVITAVQPVIDDTVTADKPVIVEETVITEKTVTDDVQTVIDDVKIVEDETAKIPDDFPKTNDVQKLVNSFKSLDTEVHINGNGYDKPRPRTSNEIKMAVANGAPKDVIRANDPPEDDLPKNIGVNKFVNFFESLGGKK